MQSSLFNLMLLAIGFAVLILVPLRAILRTRSGSFSATERCVQCNHNRRNIPGHRPCPECGTPPGIHGVGCTPDMNIVICRGCRQSLEGLAWDTTCPECGLPSAAMPRFHRKEPRRFSAGRLFDSFLILLWVAALLFCGAQLF